MVNISKHPIREEVLVRVYELLFEIVGKRNRNDFIELLSEVLTPAEKIMIAKRIVAMYLLLKGISQRAVARAVKISPATAANYALLLARKKGKLDQIIKSLLLKEEVKKLIEDAVFNLFVQPGIKKGHWELYWQNKKDKSKVL